MKTLAVVLSFWAFSVHAADECKSVWAYKPYKTCSDARNGLDLSKATPTGETKVLPTQPLQGGEGSARQEADCARIAKTLQIKMPQFGVLAENTAISEGTPSKDMVGRVTYVYQCTFRMMQAPFKTRGEACGEEDKYSYQSQGTSVALEGKAHCLSCDAGKLNRTQLTACLKKSQDILAEAGDSIPLRKEDRQAVLARVELLLKLEKQNETLSVEELGKMVDLKDQLQKGIPAQ